MLNFILPRENQEGREAHRLFQWYGEWIYLIQRGKGGDYGQLWRGDDAVPYFCDKRNCVYL